MQDKTEWKLSGQVLNFNLPLTDQVKTLSIQYVYAPFELLIFRIIQNMYRISEYVS